MKTKNLLKFMLALVAAGMFGACGTDDPAKEHHYVKFNNHFAYTTASANFTEPSSETAGEIVLDFYNDNQNVNISIASLPIQGATISNLNLTKLPMVTDVHGVRTVKIDNLTKYGAVYPVQGIEMTYWPELRRDDKKYHAMYMRVSLADGRDITVLPRTSVGFGTTEVTTIASGDKYVSTQTVYEMTLNPSDSTASLYVINPKFAENMPPVGDMTFAGTTEIPERLTFTEDGYKVKCARLVPEIAGTPFNRFVITALNCEADLAKNQLEVEFYCAGAWSVDAVVGALYVEMLK